MFGGLQLYTLGFSDLHQVTIPFDSTNAGLLPKPRQSVRYLTKVLTQVHPCLLAARPAKNGTMLAANSPVRSHDVTARNTRVVLLASTVGGGECGRLQDSSECAGVTLRPSLDSSTVLILINSCNMSLASYMVAVCCVLLAAVVNVTTAQDDIREWRWNS